MPSASKKTSKKSAESTAPAQSTKNESSLPAWPRLERPFVAPSSLQEVLPGQIVTIPGFWDPSFCKKLVAFLRSLPLVTTPGKPKRGEAVRVNDRFQTTDGAFARRLWEETGLMELIKAVELDDGAALPPDGPAASDATARQNELWGGSPVGLSPNIRVYRYSAGQYFDQHYDESNTVTLDGPPSIPAKTTWTLLLYLTSPSEGCEGGETVFYPDPLPGKKKGKQEQPPPIVVGLETGLLLLHRHGNQCLLHEGREVTAGEKWVLRTDLCIRR